MFVKPSSAFVGMPVASSRAPRAARRTRGRRGCCRRRGRAPHSRAGPSSSWSSSPVSVFGLTSPSVSQRGTFVREDDRNRPRGGRRPWPALYPARMLVTHTVRTRQSFPSPTSTSTAPHVLLAERHRAHRLASPASTRATRTPALHARRSSALVRVDGASGVAAPDRRRGRRLPRRHAARRELGPEHVGRAGGPRSHGRRARARPLRVGRGALGRGRPHARTTRWCRRPTTRSSTPGSGSGSAISTSTRSARRRPRRSAPRRHRGLSLRLARRDDLDALARLDVALPAHQALSPVFSRRALPTVEDARAEYEADFDDPRFATFVVEREGEVIGSAIALRDRAVVRPQEPRAPAGRGLPRLRLGAARGPGPRRGASARRGGARLGARDGREWVVTDWRMTNLLSSRAWPRLGFRPTFYRLYRAIA